MLPKERVKRAIKHETSDIIPYHIDLTRATARRIAAYYGVPIHDVEDFIGNHLARVDIAEASTSSGDSTTRPEDPDLVRDEFGVTWRKEGQWRDMGDWGGIIDFPLKEPDLSTFKLPDPRDPKRFEHLPSFIQAHQDRMVVVSLLGLFDLAWHVRGFENLLCDFGGNATFVNDLLDMALEFNIALIRELSRFNIDGIRFVEDWGQQKGLIMGPTYWCRYLKPRLRMMYAEVHKAGLPVFIHTCGDVFEIFEDIVELEVDVINPVQPECMDVYEIKRRWGKDICLFGGIGAQSTLRYGSSDDVRKTAREVMHMLGDGGGYILSSAGAIPADVPVENIVALIEIARSQ
ncbi:MAG: hypothetical protein HPY71_10490 [Firmicutes bacterium]|nr:hypothetical protein [Bacillota bacterium]